MQTIDGQVVRQKSFDGVDAIEVTQMFTYDEAEQEENKINRENAKRVFDPYSVSIMTELLDHMSLLEAFVLSFINYYMGRGSGRFYFTNEQLASVARCSPNSISRVIVSLEEKNYIAASRKMRAGGGQIRFVTKVNLPLTKMVSSNSPKWVVATHQNGEGIDTKIIDTKKRKNTPSVPQVVNPKNSFIRGIHSPSSERFAEFWREYPRKVGKVDAMRVFAKLNPDDALLKVILDAVEKQRKSPAWTKDGGQFIPHPATWLTGMRWQDEVNVQAVAKEVYKTIIPYYEQ